MRILLQFACGILFFVALFVMSDQISMRGSLNEILISGSKYYIPAIILLVIIYFTKKK